MELENFRDQVAGLEMGTGSFHASVEQRFSGKCKACLPLK